MFDFINNLNLDSAMKLLRSVLIFVILISLSNILLGMAKRRILKRTKSKKQQSNIEILSRAIKYFIFVVVLIFAILAYTGSLGGIGLAAGFLTAALGFALQKPISGVAAWLMVVINRPFEIGDRISIGEVKGDVLGITLSHTHIGEIGGTIEAEERSGRVILIPNSKLFEENVINYTKTGETILDDVKISITFESDLEKMKEIALQSATKILKDFIGKTEESYLRISFQPSGIDIVVRYHAPAASRVKIESLITEEIFKKIRSSKNIEFAYPHMEVLLRKK